jgi:hypothetical protein
VAKSARYDIHIYFSVSLFLLDFGQIYEEIMREGYNKERECFVMHYGSDSLDASLLVMPLVFFVSPTDPRCVRKLCGNNFILTFFLKIKDGEHSQTNPQNPQGRRTGF